MARSPAQAAKKQRLTEQRKRTEREVLKLAAAMPDEAPPPYRVTPLFEKLNLKGLREILVLGAPPSFEAELARLEGIRILRDPEVAAQVRFALGFATTQAEVDELTRVLCPRAEGDALLWFAYPKGTSKRFRCEFNRDTGWEALRAAGFDSVRMVAIDEDWSALRFRRTHFIRSSR
jgi:hypothetical protein